MVTVWGNEKRFGASAVRVMSRGEPSTALLVVTVSWKVSPSVMTLFEAVSVRSGYSLSSMTSCPVPSG